MINLEKTSDYSSRQFAVFRIIFGLYLTWHLISLIPHGVELFSSEGIMSGVNPFAGKWWNPLFLENSAKFITPWLFLAALASLSIVIGWMRRISALFLVITWSCLFTANPLIANPSLGYIGMLMLLLTVIPSGEKFQPGKNDPLWKMPAIACATAWVLLGAGYTFSGILKLSSPSWIDGSALEALLLNPLARPGFVRDFMLYLPDGFLELMTYGVLWLEVLFLPLMFFKRIRPWIWLTMLFIHIGIMFTVDFADLSLGMIMVHLFTYQRCWLPAKLAPENRKYILFFDGECSFCQHSIRTLMSIDSKQSLHFSSLTGKAAKQLPEPWRITGKDDHATASAVLLEQKSDKQKHWRGADAILRSLHLAGGPLAVLWLLHYVPKCIKDRIYQWISRRRLKLISTACPLPSYEQQQRILP